MFPRCYFATPFFSRAYFPDASSVESGEPDQVWTPIARETHWQPDARETLWSPIDRPTFWTPLQ